MQRDWVAHLQEVGGELSRQCLLRLDVCDRLMSTNSYQRSRFLPLDQTERVRILESSMRFIASISQHLWDCNERLRSAETPTKELLDYLISRLEGIEMEIEIERGRLIPLTEGNALLDSVREFLEAVRDANDLSLVGRPIPDPARVARIARARNPRASPNREGTNRPPRPAGVIRLPPRINIEPVIPGYPAGQAIRADLAARFPVGQALRDAIANIAGDTTYRDPPRMRRGHRAEQEAQAFTEQTDDPDDPQFWRQRRNRYLRKEQPFDFSTPPPYVPRRNERILPTPRGGPPFHGGYHLPLLKLVPGPRYVHPTTEASSGGSPMWRPVLPTTAGTIRGLPPSMLQFLDSSSDSPSPEGACAPAPHDAFVPITPGSDDVFASDPHDAFVPITPGSEDVFASDPLDAFVPITTCSEDAFARDPLEAFVPITTCSEDAFARDPHDAFVPITPGSDDVFFVPSSEPPPRCPICDMPNGMCIC